MKLLIYSDLHLESSAFVPDRRAVRDADVVVLAGDIHPGVDGVIWARQCFGDKPVVYVAGNHEFFGMEQEWCSTLDALRSAAAAHEVHFLENASVEIGGVKFLGCTLWTDFEYFGQKTAAEIRKAADSSFADYSNIQADADTQSGLLTSKISIARHRHSLAWLERELPQNEPNAVVVTHHFPHRFSCPPRFASSAMTAAYGSNIATSTLAKAGLWIHGHVHTSCDYVVNDAEKSVRVLANPRGYGPTAEYPTDENPDFRSDYIVTNQIDGSWNP